MRELRDFARFVGKYLGFKVSADGMDLQEFADGFHLEGGLALPKHPWEIYRTGNESESGWAVYPATVNGTIEPEIGSTSLFDDDPPILTGGDDFSAYLEFDVDADSREAGDGKYYLLSGSQELSNVKVTTSPGETEEVTVDEDTGVVTPGHYVYLLATVAEGKKTSQPMRFSVYYTLCSGGGLIISAYG